MRAEGNEFSDKKEILRAIDVHADPKDSRFALNCQKSTELTEINTLKKTVHHETEQSGCTSQWDGVGWPSFVHFAWGCGPSCFHNTPNQEQQQLLQTQS